MLARVLCIDCWEIRKGERIDGSYKMCPKCKHAFVRRASDGKVTFNNCPYDGTELEEREDKANE